MCDDIPDIADEIIENIGYIIMSEKKYIYNDD